MQIILQIIIRYSQVYDENHVITVDVPTAADAVANFQQVMMDRFKFEIFHGLGIQ